MALISCLDEELGWDSGIQYRWNVNGHTIRTVETCRDNREVDVGRVDHINPVNLDRKLVVTCPGDGHLSCHGPIVAICSSACDSGTVSAYPVWVIWNANMR